MRKDKFGARKRFTRKLIITLWMNSTWRCRPFRSTTQIPEPGSSYCYLLRTIFSSLHDFIFGNSVKSLKGRYRKEKVNWPKTKKKKFEEFPWRMFDLDVKTLYMRSFHSRKITSNLLKKLIFLEKTRKFPNNSRNISEACVFPRRISRCNCLKCVVNVKAVYFPTHENGHVLIYFYLILINYCPAKRNKLWRLWKQNFYLNFAIVPDNKRNPTNKWLSN